MFDTSLQPRQKAPAADFSLAIINVVFLLLFFFSLTGSIVQRNEMAVRPPDTKNLPLERLPRPLIAIAKNGVLTLDGQELSMKALLKQIGESIARKDGTFRRLNILVDKDYSAKTFLARIDGLRATNLPMRIVTVRAQKHKRP